MKFNLSYNLVEVLQELANTGDIVHKIILNAEFESMERDCLDITEDGTSIMFRTGTKGEPGDWDITPQSSRIGRFINWVIRKATNKADLPEYNQQQLSEFSERYRGFCEMPEYKIFVVKGEDIRRYYLEDEYCNEEKHKRGQLWESCMRYEACQPYFDIYVNNPQVSMMVMTYKETGGLVARMLLWDTPFGKISDRIYYSSEFTKTIVTKWANNNTIGNVYDSSVDRQEEFNQWKLEGGKIELNETSHELYPYADSFWYIDDEENTVYWEHSDSKLYTIQIQDTDGGHSCGSNVTRCVLSDQRLNVDNAASVEHLGNISKEFLTMDNKFKGLLIAVHGNQFDISSEYQDEEGNIVVPTEYENINWLSKNADVSYVRSVAIYPDIMSKLSDDFLSQFKYIIKPSFPEIYTENIHNVCL